MSEHPHFYPNPSYIHWSSWKYSQKEYSGMHQKSFMSGVHKFSGISLILLLMH